MPNDLTFNIPIPTEPQGKPIPAAEYEQRLLARLQQCERQYTNSRLRVIWNAPGGYPMGEPATGDEVNHFSLHPLGAPAAGEWAGHRLRVAR